MSKVTWQGVVAGIILGFIFAPQLRKIPGVSKVPTL